jgi:hypothetical protein
MSLLVLADPTYALALTFENDQLPTKRLVDYIINVPRKLNRVEGFAALICVMVVAYN